LDPDEGDGVLLGFPIRETTQISPTLLDPWVPEIPAGLHTLPGNPPAHAADFSRSIDPAVAA
jgi:hypothetical protein